MELPAIKARMMKRVFTDIEKKLKEKDICPIYADYKERVYGYYEQNRSNWPSLNCILNDEKTLALRIEIDHCLYYGVCNWDDSGKSNPHGLNDDLDRIVAKRVHKYTGQKTDVFYLWKYLPIDKIDFRGCNEDYMKLYDAKSYGEMIGKICDEIFSFLSEWECAK
jgi:hypothetical protein